MLRATMTLETNSPQELSTFRHAVELRDALHTLFNRCVACGTMPRDQFTTDILDEARRVLVKVGALDAKIYDDATFARLVKGGAR